MSFLVTEFIVIVHIGGALDGWSVLYILVLQWCCMINACELSFCCSFLSSLMRYLLANQCKHCTVLSVSTIAGRFVKSFAIII